MARNITLQLDSGAGADLGPNFNMTATPGTITPTTATRSELLAGKTFSISSDDAVTVTTTSTGACTNSATTNIDAVEIVSITWTHSSGNGDAGVNNGSTLTITYTNPSGTSISLEDSTFPDDNYTTYNNGGTIQALAGTNVSAMIQNYGVDPTSTFLDIGPGVYSQLVNAPINSLEHTFEAVFGTTYEISADTQMTGGGGGAPA
jgi:hypothetical protein